MSEQNIQPARIAARNALIDALARKFARELLDERQKAEQQAKPAELHPADKAA